MAIKIAVKAARCNEGSACSEHENEVEKSRALCSSRLFGSCLPCVRAQREKVKLMDILLEKKL